MLIDDQAGLVEMWREWKTESKGEKHARKSRRLKVVTLTRFEKVNKIEDCLLKTS